MAIVSQGNSVVVDLGPTDAIWIKSTGNAAVLVNQTFAGTPDSFNVTTDVQRVGYYGEPVQVTIRAVTGQAEYQDQQFSIQPLTSTQMGGKADSSATDVALAVNGLISFAPPTQLSLPSELAHLVGYGRGGCGWGCNVQPATLWDTTVITSKIYVDSKRPDDAGNGLTWATAKQSIEAGIFAANALGVATRVLVKTGSYYRQISVGKDSLPKTLTVPMTIEAQYGRVITGTFDVLTWTKTGGQTNVYQATRSGVQSVWNTTILDASGDYLKYSSVASIAACDAAPGSFYTDNVTLYVHTHTSTQANNASARAYLNAAGADFKTPHNFLVSGIDFEGGNNAAFTCRDGESNYVIMNDCTAKYAAVNPLATIAGKDGVQVLGCKIFAAFDSSASSNGKDGFNFHIQGDVSPFWLLVRCNGYSNGFVPTSTSNNGVTAHDGVHGVEIGGNFEFSIGANAGHVDNGTTVWHLGSVVGSSDGDVINGGTWDWGAFGMWNGNGTMILQECQDKGARIGVYAPSPATAILINHSGSGQRVGNIQ